MINERKERLMTWGVGGFLHENVCMRLLPENPARQLDG